MKEAIVWSSLCAVFAVLVFVEGRRNAELEAQVPLQPKDLYQRLARSKIRLQLIDARDGEEAYQDAHIPGAIPFPGCDPSAAPNSAIASAPSIIISDSGDGALFARCRSYFITARNLAGGMSGWSDANYPEDVGDYSPPTNRTGGGCL